MAKHLMEPKESMQRVALAKNPDASKNTVNAFKQAFIAVIIANAVIVKTLMDP